MPQPTKEMVEAFEPREAAERLVAMAIAHLTMIKVTVGLGPHLAKALEHLGLAFLEIEDAEGEPPPTKSQR